MADKKEEEKKHGFAAIPPEEMRAIASKGGLAAQAKGVTRQFTPETARQAGRLGGAKISQDKDHMSEIGRRGGFARKANRERERLEKEKVRE